MSMDSLRACRDNNGNGVFNEPGESLWLGKANFLLAHFVIIICRTF